MLAPAAVIRPQAPIRIRCGRGSRPVGRIDGAGLISQNWAESAAGRRRGWISTTLPAGVRSVIVTMAMDDTGPAGQARSAGLARSAGPAGPAGRRAGPPADTWLLSAAGRIPLRASRPGQGKAGPGPGGLVRLRCPVPRSVRADEPVCVLVAPRPGWYQYGLSAGPDRGAATPGIAAGSVSTAAFAQVRLS
jgi:hypothetical protein